MNRLDRNNRRVRRPATHGRRAVRPVLEGLEDRLLLYATNGGHWVYGARITYSFVPDGTNIGGVASNLYATLNAVTTTANWQSAFEKAAAYWSSYANINLALVSDNGAPMGTDGNQQDDPRFGDIRISMAPQSGSVLAYTILPPPLSGGTDAGDIVFNSNIAWHFNSDYDIETVALHEMGHALGLDHTTVTGAVMYPYYNGVNQTLSSDDIAGIQSLYGAYPADTDTNRTLGTAAVLTPDANAQVAVSGLSLAGSGDVDCFKVTVPSNTNGTLTVSMQSTNLSSVSPKVSVYNGAQSLVTYVSLPNSFGATATVKLTGVTAGQVYYFRCAAASSMGAYGAYGLLVNMGSQAQAPIAPPNTVVRQQPDQGGGSESMQQGPAVYPWSPGAPQPLDLGPAIQQLWGSAPAAPVDDQEGIQVVLGGGQLVSADPLLAPAGKPLASPAASGPLSPSPTGTAGPKEETVVVNLAAATPAGPGAPHAPTTSTPVVIAPWTATGAPAFDAALAQWGAEHLNQTGDRGLTLWPTRPRPRFVL